MLDTMPVSSLTGSWVTPTSIYIHTWYNENKSSTELIVIDLVADQVDEGK